GVTTAKSWTEALIEGGKDPSTPVALIRRCSLPDQQTAHCRLDEVADRLTPASKFRPPVISIIGPVTRLAETMDWLSRRPLHGQTILVTRPADKSDGLSDPLRELGANVIEQPLIETSSLEDFGILDRAIENMPDSDWLVFCSPTAVKYWADRLADLGLDSRSTAGCRIACIGVSTQAELWNRSRLKADLVPTEHTSDQLAEELAMKAPVRVSVFRANRGRDVIRPRLESIGTEVIEVAAYLHRNVQAIDESVRAAVQTGRIDWITVTSSATADQLDYFFGNELQNVKLAALSSITAETLDRRGHEVSVVADTHTMAGLVDAIVASMADGD
ncbi:MAG: uroporphyrinogen-III synthase, partial [Planctomycetota bacterium]